MVAIQPATLKGLHHVPFAPDSRSTSFDAPTNDFRELTRLALEPFQGSRAAFDFGPRVRQAPNPGLANGTPSAFGGGCAARFPRRSGLLKNL
jgi:hypothetical protein